MKREYFFQQPFWLVLGHFLSVTYIMSKIFEWNSQFGGRYLEKFVCQKYRKVWESLRKIPTQAKAVYNYYFSLKYLRVLVHWSFTFYLFMLINFMPFHSHRQSSIFYNEWIFRNIPHEIVLVLVTKCWT